MLLMMVVTMTYVNKPAIVDHKFAPTAMTSCLILVHWPYYLKK